MKAGQVIANWICGYVAVVLLLFAVLVLSGCAAAPISGQQPVPEQFLQECVAAKRELRTNGDLSKALLDYREALAACNLDKKAIRDWSDGVVESK
jgi:PBP1b-binding outer membrane lipoprotein LpoB